MTDTPTTTSAPALPPVPTGSSLSSPAPRFASPVFLLAVLGAIGFGCLAAAGLVVGALLLSREQPAPPAKSQPVAVVPEKPVRDPAEEARLADERKKLQDAQEKLERDQKQLKVSGLVGEGKIALALKDYPTAEKKFQSALDAGAEGDNRAVALAGLVDARAALDSLKRNQGDETRRKEQLDKFLSQARQAVANKQLAVAVLNFQSALVLSPDNDSIRKELAAAQAILDADLAEKKKLADYQDHMKAGRAFLVGQQFLNALVEFRAAQQAMPGDAQAILGERAAQAGLNPPAQPVRVGNKDNKTTPEFQDKLDSSRRALMGRRFQEAIDLAQAALKMIPDNPDAAKQLQNARDAQKDARTQFLPVMEQAKSALVLKQYGTALTLFGNASQIMPEDPEAIRGMELARAAQATLIVGQAAYNNFMQQGSAAMKTRRYADAVTAYTGALNLVPNDADAMQGLQNANAALARQVKRKADFDKAVQAGNAAMTSKRYADAVQAFTAAQNLDPDNQDVANLLANANYGMYMKNGQLAAQSGQIAAAIASYQQALNAKPNDPAATRALRALQMKR